MSNTSMAMKKNIRNEMAKIVRAAYGLFPLPSSAETIPQTKNGERATNTAESHRPNATIAPRIGG